MNAKPDLDKYKKAAKRWTDGGAPITALYDAVSKQDLHCYIGESKVKEQRDEELVWDHALVGSCDSTENQSPKNYPCYFEKYFPLDAEIAKKLLNKQSIDCKEHFDSLNPVKGTYCYGRNRNGASLWYPKENRN